MKNKKVIKITESDLNKIIEKVILEKESEKWIQKAIKHPGSLRKKMSVKKGETIPSSEIESNIKSLKKKDKDPKKSGVQGLGSADLKKYRQLLLAKKLKSMKK